MPITRRAMLALLSSSTYFFTASRVRGQAPPLPGDAPAPRFNLGVASGDPQPDAVMLWTRAAPPASAHGGTQVPLLLQLSTDENFNGLLLQQQLATGPDGDYTVRAYVDGLEPDTTYYYRFLGATGAQSRPGRTRTAPAPGQDKVVNLAFTSCQNFENGYYGSWARMLADDLAAPEEEQIQFVLHLGDFIYERCWYQGPDGGPQARRVAPFPRGVQTDQYHYGFTLADYRHLYQTYLGDPHLQAARARWPFICTWDDHEFSNDSFQSYSTYGDTPVAEPRRRKVANKAWFEYIPSVLGELEDQPAHNFRHLRLDGDEAYNNKTAINTLSIYRKLGWGKNLDIVLTDNRSYRSEPCLPDGFASTLDLPLNTVELVAIADAGRSYADGKPPATLPGGDGKVANPARERAPGTLLGEEQRQWFLDTLASSTARWKVWANSLPLLPLRLDLSALPLAGLQDSVFSIDSWAGYPHELDLILRQLQERGVAGVVSLSGDHHMHGAGAVNAPSGTPDAPPVVVDFNVAGISSNSLFSELVEVAGRDHPDFRSLVARQEDGRVIPVWNMTMLDGAFAALIYSKTGLAGLARWLGPNHANPGLKYVDTTANGYGLARFSASGLELRLVTMSDCRVPFEGAPAISHVARFELPNWQSGEGPQLAGPEFELGAPFPFEPPAV